MRDLARIVVLGGAAVAMAGEANACFEQLKDPKLIGTAKAGVAKPSEVSWIWGRQRFTRTAAGETVQSFPMYTRCPTTRFTLKVPADKIPQVGEAFSVSIDPRIEPPKSDCVDLSGVSDKVTRMDFKETDGGYEVSYTLPLDAYGLGNCHKLVRR